MFFFVLGLHRYRVGDILQVTGFYNSAPQFRFIRRQNVVLSVYLEATTEEDLLNAVTNATQLLNVKAGKPDRCKRYNKSEVKEIDEYIKTNTRTIRNRIRK